MDNEIEPGYAGQAVTRSTFDQVMVPTYAPAEMLPVRASGLDLWDQEGNHYLDFTSGIAVTSLGHVNEEIGAALSRQLDTLWHLGNGYTNEPVLRLATRLTELTFAERAFFCNSGAEANEAALKLARKYAFDRFGPQRTRIVSCLSSFHGRTLFTVSVGGQPKYTEGFAPLPRDLGHIPFNDIEAARAAITDDVAAVIVEPIQGEGGVLPADRAYLQALREACDKTGTLLVFDEVQSGMGRIGSLFAYMHFGVVPDIMTVAKALGNGFPCGAMLTTADIARHLAVGTHGSTYGGNPLASVVGLKVLDIMTRPGFMERVGAAGAAILGNLQRLCADYPTVFQQPRGMGLLLGLPLADTYKGRSRDFTKIAEKLGLMLLVAGPDVVRLAPALVVSDEQIAHADTLMRKTVETFVGGVSRDSASDAAQAART